MDKPYRAPKRRGPPPTLPAARVTSIVLGARERAMIRLYSERHGVSGISATVRAALHLLCADFDDEEISREIERENLERNL